VRARQIYVCGHHAGERIEPENNADSEQNSPQGAPDRDGPCARSTKAAASASRRGATMPRSVISPVTRRAGLTSKP
jgi:hypothetical protein